MLTGMMTGGRPPRGRAQPMEQLCDLDIFMTLAARVGQTARWAQRTLLCRHALDGEMATVFEKLDEALYLLGFLVRPRPDVKARPSRPAVPPEGSLPRQTSQLLEVLSSIAARPARAKAAEPAADDDMRPPLAVTLATPSTPCRTSGRRWKSATPARSSRPRAGRGGKVASSPEACRQKAAVVEATATSENESKEDEPRLQRDRLRAKRMYHAVQAAVAALRDQRGRDVEEGDVEDLVATGLEAVEEDIESMGDFDSCAELAWQVADWVLQGAEFEEAANALGLG
mmetsp:Transcript_78491/g.202129  ORF Transcript_78491/g.202129 Transcript_78491/m.202129 type:complete len:285 (-) Transcript_78491:426-1280(-)